MKKKLVFSQLLIIIFFPILTLIGCKFFYDKKSEEGLNIVIDSFINNTSQISRAFILNKEKKWDPNYIIDNILNASEGNVKKRDNFFSYFGKDSSYNWQPNYEYFVEDITNIPDILNIKKSLSSYEKPFEKLVKQNNMLEETIQPTLATLHALTASFFTKIFDSQESMNKILYFLNVENINKFRDFYSENKINDLIEILQKKINEHNQLIDKTYEEALKWSSINIKKLILQMGCIGLENKKFCKFENDEEVETKYDYAMQEFFHVKIVDTSTYETKMIFNEQIKENLQKGIKKIENIINLAVYSLPIISYILNVFDKVYFDDVKITWFKKSDIDKEGSVYKKEIIDPIKNQLSLKYKALDKPTINNIKLKLSRILSLENDGLFFRKILLILQLTPSLKTILSPFRIKYTAIFFDIVNVSILELLALNGHNYTIGKITNGFSLIFEKFKSKFPDFEDYLDYLPDSINNLDIDMKIFWNNFNKLLISLNKTLTLENIDKLKETISKNDKEATLKVLFDIIGFKDYKIIEDGFADTLIKFKEQEETSKLLNFILDNKDGLLKRVIDKNKDKVNRNFLNWVLKDDYWELNNKKINYYEKNDTLEISYELTLLEKAGNKTYYIVWKTRNYYSLSYNDFKITSFQKI